MSQRVSRFRTRCVASRVFERAGGSEEETQNVSAIDQPASVSLAVLMLSLW